MKKENKHSFTNQISSDNINFSQNPIGNDGLEEIEKQYDKTILGLKCKKYLDELIYQKTIDSYFYENDGYVGVKESKAIMFLHKKEVEKIVNNFDFLNIVSFVDQEIEIFKLQGLSDKSTESTVKLYNRHKLETVEKGDNDWKYLSENIEYNNLLIEKINLMLDKNYVIYEKVGKDTKFSVDLIIELLGFQKSILNSGDYNPPRLMIFDKFVLINSEIRKYRQLNSTEHSFCTKMSDNSGFEFNKDGIISWISWVDID